MTICECGNEMESSEKACVDCKAIAAKTNNIRRASASNVVGLKEKRQKLTLSKEKTGICPICGGPMFRGSKNCGKCYFI